MRLGQQVIGGIIGGAVGTGAWVAIASYTGYNVDFLAWGVGLLAGLGALAMAGGRSTALGAVLAGLIALAAVLGGKAGIAYLKVDQVRTELGLDGRVGKEMAITAIAEDVQKDFLTQGLAMDDQWPRGVLKSNDPRAFYTPQVWAEAERRWGELTPSEQLAMRDRADDHADAHASLKTLLIAAFLGSFSLYDVIWLVLASMSAFKIASAGSEEGPGREVVRSAGPTGEATPRPNGAGPTGNPAGPNFLPMRKPDAEPTNVPLSRRGVSMEDVQNQGRPAAPAEAPAPAPERQDIEPAPPGHTKAHADRPDLGPERATTGNGRAAA